MKKLIVFVTLLFISFIGFSQKYFQTFGWTNNNLSLYYANDTTKYYQYSCNYGSTCYHYCQDSYSIGINDTNVCFLVFPKRFFYLSCYPYNNGWGGDNTAPYNNYCSYGSDNSSTQIIKYAKPKGNLNIPYYNIRLENSIPQYRTVIGISERTFYGCDSLVKITIPSTVKEIGRMFVYGCDMLDTVVFENTFNEDTIYPPTMNDYTWCVTQPITIVVPCNSYDTFYNYIHSLNTPQIVQLNIIPDQICNCNAYTLDTIQVYDTIRVNETIYDTIQIYDTIVTNIYNTHHIYDTIFVNDTIWHNVWNMYYDTTIVNVFDTIYETITNVYNVFDTIIVSLIDTIVVYSYINEYDTIYETIYDTILVFVQTPQTYDDLKLYPIPTRDYVNVEYSGQLDYKLYNDRGKFLECGTIMSYDKLDLTKYASGTYYFKATLDNGDIVTKKVIKMTL